jgi:hypothetical protein
MTRYAQCLTVLVLTASTLLQAASGSAPSLRRSENVIRKWLLREDPLGSSMEEVIETIERHGWTNVDIDRTKGFKDERTRPAKRTGAKSIQAYLGEYRSVFYIMTVEVAWGFDEEGRLVDVWVRKEGE